VKRWIRISQGLRRSKYSRGEPWTLTMEVGRLKIEPWRVCRQFSPIRITLIRRRIRIHINMTSRIWIRNRNKVKRWIRIPDPHKSDVDSQPCINRTALAGIWDTWDTWCVVSRTPCRGVVDTYRTGTSCVVGSHRIVCTSVEYLSAGFQPVLSWCSWYWWMLKVVGNEKIGGSRRWHMIDISLGPW
jgi:hypothetical protein